MRHSSRYAFLLLGAATLLAAGCEKPRSETAAEDTLATRTGETMYPDTGTPRLVSIDLGKAIGADMRVTDETDDFGPRDTIYASIHTSGNLANAALTARWLFEDGQVVDSTTQTVNLAGDGYTEFHISKATAWPVGKYKLEILLNGQKLGEEEFEIKTD